MDKNLLSVLSKVEFFTNFTEPEKRLLLSMPYLLAKFKDGNHIIREGDKRDNSLYVLLKGSARITKNVEPMKVLNTMMPGNVFGEISFLTQTQRTSNVISQGDSVCFVLKNEHVDELPTHLQIKIKDCLIAILVKRLIHLDHMNLNVKVLDDGIINST